MAQRVAASRFASARAIRDNRAAASLAGMLDVVNWSCAAEQCRSPWWGASE